VSRSIRQLRAFALIGICTVIPALAIGALTNLITSQYSQTSIGGFNARVFYALAAAGVAYVVLRYQSISGARGDHQHHGLCHRADDLGNLDLVDARHRRG
jgi:hypothetical protein